MKNNKNKLNPHFFRKMSNGLDIALMFYKTRLNPQQTQKGNTLLIGLGFGLLVMLLGGLAIAKANNNKINASINTDTAQSLAVTDAGIVNLITQLNTPTTRPLLMLNQDPSGLLGCVDDTSTTQVNECNEWADTTGDVKLEYTNAVNSCGGGTPSSVAEQITSFDVDDPANSDPVAVGTGLSAGEYKFVAYRFEDPDGDPTTPANQVGRLLVEGNLSKSGKESSASRMEVRFPVSLNPAAIPTGGPGTLMANKISFGNPGGGGTGSYGLTGNAICTDPSQCPITCSTGATTPTDAQLKNAIGATSSSALAPGSTITIGGSIIPPVPNVPLAAIDDKLVYTITGGGVVLPRTGEVAQDGIFYYQTGPTVDFNTDIEVTIGNEVRIYHDGTITSKGNDVITAVNTDGTRATPTVGQIRVYGASVDSDTGQAILASNKTWIFGGNGCIHAVIHAPNTSISYNGAGNGEGCSSSPGLSKDVNFYGVVWVKEFGNPKNNAQTLDIVTQPGLLTLLTTEFGQEAFTPDSVTMSSVSQRDRRGF